MAPPGPLSFGDYFMGPISSSNMHRVPYVFGDPGATEQAFMHTLADVPELEFILCLHEGVAVAMADAYARATRGPAVVLLHTGVGLGNAAGMLLNARAGQSPLVVYVGQVPARARLLEPHLFADLVGLATPVSKWAYQGRRGRGCGARAAPRHEGRRRSAPRPGSWLSPPISSTTRRRPCSRRRNAEPVRGDPEALSAAAAILRAATRPLLIVGDGVAAADAQTEVGLLAEALGAPIYQGYASDVNVAWDHPLLPGSVPIVPDAACAPCSIGPTRCWWWARRCFACSSRTRLACSPPATGDPARPGPLGARQERRIGAPYPDRPPVRAARPAGAPVSRTPGGRRAADCRAGGGEHPAA